MTPRKSLIAWLVVAFGCSAAGNVVGSGTALAATYNAVADFSLTTNTASNTWSYWYNASTDVDAYTSGLALNPVLFNTTCGFGTSCWDQTVSLNDLIMQNVTGSDAPFPNGIGRDGQLTFYTRSGLELVRFTAPVVGTYAVSGFFEGNAVNPEQTTEAIGVDGSVISQSTESVPFDTVNPFNFTENLAAGGTIDFFVAGISTTPDLNSLATGFDATITQGTTPVPEPTSVALLGVGLLGVSLIRRKPTRQQ